MGAASPASVQIKLWVGTEEQHHEMEISVGNGAQILFVFLLPACRIRKHQTWATNQAKSGSSSPLTQRAEDRESSGVSRECEGMQRLN